MKFITTTIWLILFGVAFAEIFVIDLQLKSVDRYVNSLKYQSPPPLMNTSRIGDDDDNSSNGHLAPSTLSTTNDDGHRDIDEMIDVAGDSHMPGDIDRHCDDNETQSVLRQMYQDDYIMQNSSDEYTRLRNL